MAKTVFEQRVRKAGEQEFMPSDEITGKRVENPEGYDLGEISNLWVGLPTGKVAYAVLRTGGMLGLGAKLFAIPIEAMVYRPGDDVFVVNISKSRIESASGFAEGEWPREANWNLIESTRPIGPPSQEEARAVTQAEPPPREVVTTERVEVREKSAGEEIEVKAEDVESRAERPSAADLQAYLWGMSYPAGKGDLISHAQERNAPLSMIVALEQLSDRSYRSAADVNEEFGLTRHS